MDLWAKDGIGLALLHTAIIALSPLISHVCDLDEYQDTLDTLAETLAVVAGGLWVSCGAGEPDCSASRRSRIIRGAFAWPFELK